MPESFYGNRTRERTNANVIGQYPTVGDLPNASGLAIGTRAFVVNEQRFYDVTLAGWEAVPISGLATYDSNDDGRVDAADHAMTADSATTATAADAATVADNISGAPPTDSYYGTDAAGAKGFHPMPDMDVVAAGSQLVLYEDGDGIWRHGATGLPAARELATITEWYSAGPQRATLPPRNAVTGMRPIDRYERLGPSPAVMMMVPDSTALSAGENALAELFEDTGFAVVLRAPTTSMALPTTDDYQVVWISYGVDVATLPVGLAGAAIPIICNKREFLDTLGMIDTDANTATTGNSETSINIIDGAHAAAGDMTTGVLEIYDPANPGDVQHLLSSALPIGAEVVAEQAAGRGAVVAYPTNITLLNGVGGAPARRLFAGHFTKPHRYTENAQTLFRSLVYWAAGYDY